MTAVHLRRVDPERNMRRFYRLDVQPDLADHWRLRKVNHSFSSQQR